MPPVIVVDTRTGLAISFDPAKRAWTLAQRGIDFAQALEVFAGDTVELEDRRRDYGESRVLCYGLLGGRMVVIGYVQRGRLRHVFMMRKANGREKARYALDH